jgi:hypothetical protein
MKNTINRLMEHSSRDFETWKKEVDDARAECLDYTAHMMLLHDYNKSDSCYGAPCETCGLPKKSLVDYERDKLAYEKDGRHLLA